MTDERFNQRKKAIVHIVHDYCNLVSAGKLTKEFHQHPINHYIQHAFLMECRKFSDFFNNNRGAGGTDIVSKDYVKKKLKVQLPTWKQWRNHMNAHLLHLSYKRVDNERSWDGYAMNEQMLAEFRAMWKLLLDNLDERFIDEFREQYVTHSAQQKC